MSNGSVACTLRACLGEGGLPIDASTHVDAAVDASVDTSLDARLDARFEGSFDAPRSRPAETSVDSPASPANDAPLESSTDALADGSDDPCSVDTIYHFGFQGGLTAYDDESAIDPPNIYLHARNYHTGDAPISHGCAPALPPCGANDVISMLDIVRDLHQSDVVAVLAGAAPTFGIDPRPYDGQIYYLARHDGHGFYVGAPCGTSDAGCVPAPAGVMTLMNHLQQLDMQMLAKPECAATLQPTP